MQGLGFCGARSLAQWGFARCHYYPDRRGVAAALSGGGGDRDDRDGSSFANCQQLGPVRGPGASHASLFFVMLKILQHRLAWGALAKEELKQKKQHIL